MIKSKLLVHILQQNKTFCPNLILPHVVYSTEQHRQKYRVENDLKAKSKKRNHHPRHDWIRSAQLPNKLLSEIIAKDLKGEVKWKSQRTSLKDNNTFPRYSDDVKDFEIVNFNKFALLPSYSKIFQVKSNDAFQSFRELRTTLRKVPDDASVDDVVDILEKAIHFYESKRSLNVGTKRIRKIGVSLKNSDVKTDWIYFYKRVWANSSGDLNDDLEKILYVSSLWFRLSVKACNLYTQCFRLLSEKTSKENLIACVFYKAISQHNGLAEDKAIFKTLEKLLAKNSLNFTFAEILSIFECYFRSRQIISQNHLNVNSKLVKRAFDELRSGNYMSTHETKLILKHIKLNPLSITDDSLITELGDALNACDFFEVEKGLHGQCLILGALHACRFYDEDLLASSLKQILARVNSIGFLDERSKEVSRVFAYLASFDVHLEDRVIERFLDYFKKRLEPGRLDLYGSSIVVFMKAFAWRGLIDHDLFDAFFSSKILHLRDETLPNINGPGSHVKNPWIDILLLDEIVGILAPDYKGTRLSERFKKTAERNLETFERPNIKYELYYRKGLSKFVHATNRFISSATACKSRYVEPLFLLERFGQADVVLRLDADNRPIAQLKEKEARRKIAFQIMGRNQTYFDKNGMEISKRNVKSLCLSKLGYELYTVSCTDALKFHFAKNNEILVEKMLDDLNVNLS